jgi:hypothetical protein
MGVCKCSGSAVPRTVDGRALNEAVDLVQSPMDPKHKGRSPPAKISPHTSPKKKKQRAEGGKAVEEGKKQPRKKKEALVPAASGIADANPEKKKKKLQRLVTAGEK